MTGPIPAAAFEPTPAELDDRRAWAAGLPHLHAGACGAFQGAVQLLVIALRHGNTLGAAEHLRTILAISRAVDEVTAPEAMAV